MLNQNGDGSSNSLKDQKLCFACQASSKTSHCVEMDTDPNEIMELEDKWQKASRGWLLNMAPVVTQNRTPKVGSAE